MTQDQTPDRDDAAAAAGPGRTSQPRRGAGWWGAATAALVVAGLGLGGAAVALAAAGGRDRPGPSAVAVAPSATADRPAAAAGATPEAPEPTPATSPDAPDALPEGAIGLLPDPAWVERVAAESRIPPVALRAYAGAALRLAQEHPACRLGWNTLAAIGEVESAHGTAGGGALDEHGRAVPPVVGPPLDGRGVAAIADTDGGRLDGDPVWDRAVGPMQFIPASWETWQADGSGDGAADPQDVADSALAAARYLCAAGDLADPGTWITAIGTYNATVEYALAVADAADRYAAVG
jgi:hypothetical protein